MSRTSHPPTSEPQEIKKVDLEIDYVDFIMSTNLGGRLYQIHIQFKKNDEIIDSEVKEISDCCVISIDGANKTLSIVNYFNGPDDHHTEEFSNYQMTFKDGKLQEQPLAVTKISGAITAPDKTYFSESDITNILNEVPFVSKKDRDEIEVQIIQLIKPLDQQYLQKRKEAEKLQQQERLAQLKAAGFFSSDSNQLRILFCDFDETISVSNTYDRNEDVNISVEIITKNLRNPEELKDILFNAQAEKILILILSSNPNVLLMGKYSSVLLNQQKFNDIKEERLSNLYEKSITYYYDSTHSATISGIFSIGLGKSKANFIPTILIFLGLGPLYPLGNITLCEDNADQIARAKQLGCKTIHAEIGKNEYIQELQSLVAATKAKRASEATDFSVLTDASTFRQATASPATSALEIKYEKTW